MAELRIMENEVLRVSVQDTGAELQSVYHKKMQKEILWYGDEAFWDRRSPILFPNVGRHHENYYLCQGKKYPTVQHGFARDMEFECVEESGDCLRFKIEDTEETRKYFPFAFSLTITYRLTGSSLGVFWEVENRDGKTMYFTIGGHPGFCVPILENTRQTDYKLLFKAKENLVYKQVYGTSGTADGTKTYELELEDYGACRGVGITEHMFDNDALIFDDSQISWAGIGYPDGTPYISMECEGFTNFGVWTKPGGPYICLEPWQGRCDDYGFDGEISEKPDIIALNEKKKFELGYTITVHEYQKNNGKP